MPTNQMDCFQVIADPSRRQIINMLSAESLSINSIASHFNMSRPAVSKHIRILHESKFIEIQELGRERYCQLKQEGFNELKEWLAYYDQFWMSKLSDLEKLMNKKSIKHKRKKRKKTNDLR
jgi:DNA-binding transcriptional ArsR family regulator